MRLSAPIYKLKRRAKLMSREKGWALHRALDRIAIEEGFRNWGHLSATHPAERPAQHILSKLAPGDMLLLGARPGHGKTLLGLELLSLAMSGGRAGLVFSLEYTEAQVSERLETFRPVANAKERSPVVVTSDDICADLIVAESEPHGASAFVLIDYLQLLDQKRSNPTLSDQLGVLGAYARVFDIADIAGGLFRHFR